MIWRLNEQYKKKSVEQSYFFEQIKRLTTSSQTNQKKKN
jgi:hypothetical protein